MNEFRPATCIDCIYWHFTEMKQREVFVSIDTYTTQSVRTGICLNHEAEFDGHSCVTDSHYRRICEDSLACPLFDEGGRTV